MAVVGHAEWSEFVTLDHHPAEGEVAHAREWSRRPGGGGTVAAVALAELGATVDFFCALGRDADGEATVAHLSARGVRMHVAWREEPTRRAITYLVAGGERTIVVIGPRLDLAGATRWTGSGSIAPRGSISRPGTPARWHRRGGRACWSPPRACGRRCRRRRLTSTRSCTARPTPTRPRGRSGCRPGPGWSWPPRAPRAGAGRATRRGAGRRSPAPGPVRDHYGAGDSFAAGFMYGLAGACSVADAAALGAQAGARALDAGRGARSGREGATSPRWRSYALACRADGRIPTPCSASAATPPRPRCATPTGAWSSSPPRSQQRLAGVGAAL